MASPTSDSDTAYTAAIDCFEAGLQAIRPPESDAVGWNLNTGLIALARAIQQDMVTVKKHLAAQDSAVAELLGR
jgi:hypothetical protein